MPKTVREKSARSTVTAKKSRHTKTMPYDVASQLRTSHERVAYLDAWLVDAPDDAAGIA